MEQWISAREAIDALAPHSSRFEYQGGAKALRSLAATGAVPARARHMVKGERFPRLGQPPRSPEAETDWPVPLSFWQDVRFGYEADLAAGRAKVEPLTGDTFELVGLEFGRSELMAYIATLGRPSLPSRDPFASAAAILSKGDDKTPSVDPLGLWLDAEIRRKRIEFGERQEEDGQLMKMAGERNGARVKLIFKWMEKVAVPLADATLKKATVFGSPPEAVEKSRATIASFVKEMGDAATQMACFVGSDSLARSDAVRGRLDKLKADVDGIFRLAAMGTPAPMPAPVAAAPAASAAQRTTQKKAPHRPKKSPQALQIFADRLREGSACQNKSEEGRRIARAWTVSDPATPDSIAGWITPYHEQCQWADGKISNGASIAAAIDTQLQADKARNAG